MVTLRDGPTALGGQPPGPDRGGPGGSASARWATGQGRFLAPIVVAAGVLAWVAGAVSGLMPTGRVQIGLIVVGAVLTGVSAGLPLWQRRQADVARQDAVLAARRAWALMRVALSDTLDPFVHLLGRLTTAPPGVKDQLRGEAISLAVGALAGLGAEHRARVCYFALDTDGQTLRPERFAGRSGAPTAVFTSANASGAAALGMARGRSWLYIPDTEAQAPPCWFDEQRGYRSVLLGPVATPERVLGLISLDAPGPGELDGIDLALVQLLAAMLGTALSI